MTTKPYYIDWAITNKCDLSCEFCTGLPRTELSHNEAVKLTKQILSLEPGWLIIEGGEPFMRKDLKLVLEIIRGSTSNGRLPTYIITNGNNLDERFLHSLPPVKIIISLDGATKEVYETIKGGDFNKVTYGMKVCAELGILHGIVVVLSKKNFHQIMKFFEIVKDLKSVGALNLTPIHIIFIPLMPTNVGASRRLTPTYMENRLTPSEQRDAMKAIYKYAKDYGINAFYDEPFLWAWGNSAGIDITLKTESGVTVNEHKGCAAGRTIYIQADGEVRYCMFSPNELSVGSVREKSLKQIWEENILNSPLIREFRNCKMRNGKCKECKHFEICYGCLARIYSLCNTHLESDPACPLANGNYE